MRREIRRWKPIQDLERKKGEEKRRRKVINNVNKYNWSKGGSGDEDEWVGPAGRKTRK